MYAIRCGPYIGGNLPKVRSRHCPHRILPRPYKVCLCVPWSQVHLHNGFEDLSFWLPVGNNFSIDKYRRFDADILTGDGGLPVEKYRIPTQGCGKKSLTNAGGWGLSNVSPLFCWMSNPESHKASLTIYACFTSLLVYCLAKAVYSLARIRTANCPFQSCPHLSCLAPHTVWYRTTDLSSCALS